MSAEMGYRSAQDMLSKGVCDNNVTSKSNKTPEGSTRNIKQPEKFREDGRNEYEKGNYQEALKAMDIAIKMWNDQVYEFGEMTETETSNFNKLILGYYFDRGEIKLKLGESYGAISDFNKVLNLATNENEWQSINFSLQKLYLLKRNLGDYKGAIKHLDKIIESGPPTNAQFYNDRAALKRDNGDLEEAEIDYFRGISIDSTFTQLWGGAGSTFFKMGGKENIIDACSYWKKATKTGAAEEAKKYYQKMIDENCGDFKSDIYEPMYSDVVDFTFYNSALEKFKNNDYTGANKDISKFIISDPGDSDGWTLRGNIKTWLDDWDGAYQDYLYAAMLGNQEAENNLKEYGILSTSELENKFSESIEKAYNAFKDLANMYAEDVQNQSVAVNEKRQVELEETQAAVAGYRNFARNFIINYSYKISISPKDCNKDGFTSFLEYRGGCN
jgi:tetratricopeptide (TPR) repeat protein